MTAMNGGGNFDLGWGDDMISGSFSSLDLAFVLYFFTSGLHWATPSLRARDLSSQVVDEKLPAYCCNIFIRSHTTYCYL